jgi:xylulokinase
MVVAMLAAYGCGWYPSLKQCAQAFIQVSKSYDPIPENVRTYKKLFPLYQQVYQQRKN